MNYDSAWILQSTRQCSKHFHALAHLILLNLRRKLCYNMFSKFTLWHLFYGNPTLGPVFANQKKSKEDFCFYEKGQKTKTVFRIYFAGSLDPKLWEQPCELLPREIHSTSLHQAVIALNRVCELLGFISIYDAHLLARCGLRSVYKRWHRNALLSYSRAHLYHHHHDQFTDEIHRP